MCRASSNDARGLAATGTLRRLRKAAAMLLPVISCGIALESRAHGGVSIEDDVCIMQIDRFKAHFTGYLPKQHASKEFCEDIPEVAESVFVIDFLSNELRDMEIDFRIIRDVNDIGLQATYADLGGPEEIARATIYYEEPQHYSNGTMSVRYNFAEGGGYIGIVEAKHPTWNSVYQSVFPFRVGFIDYTQYVVYYVMLFAACGLFIFLAGRRRFFGDY